MRLSIKTKQVLGVTSIVGLAVVILSGFYLASLARVYLAESKARGDLLARAVYQRAREVVATGGPDPIAALRADPGLRSILESSVYSSNVTYAAILDTASIAIVHSDTRAHRAAAAALRRSECAARGRARLAAARHLRRRRTHARNPAAAADGNRRVRIDSHRCVHAAHSAATSPGR